MEVNYIFTFYGDKTQSRDMVAHGNVGDRFMCEMLFDKDDIDYIVVKKKYKNKEEIGNHNWL